MVKKLPIIREIFKGDHNAVAAARELKRKQINALFQGRLIMYFIIINFKIMYFITASDLHIFTYFKLILVSKINTQSFVRIFVSNNTTNTLHFL